MKKNLLLTATTFLAALLFPQFSNAQSGQDIGTLLPEDTSVLMMVRNLTTFYELPDDHAINKMGSHPAIKHLFGEATEEMGELFSEDTLEELGVTEEQLAQWFPGRFVMAGNLDLSMMLEVAAEGALSGGQAKAQGNINMKGISYLAAADTTLTEAEVTELVAAMAKSMVDKSENVEDARSFPEQFEGFPMARLEVKTKPEDGGEAFWQNYGFILANDMLIIAPIPDDRAALADSIATEMAQRIKANGTEPNALAGNRSFIDSRDQLDEADLFLFAPLEDIAIAGETAISNMFDQQGNGEAGPNPVSMFVTKEGLLDFLGLTDFKRMTIAAKIQPDGIEFVQELATNERSGIISKMMNYEQGIQLPEMDPAGLTGITISGYKLSESIEMLLQELPKLSPMLGGMLQMQLGQLEGQGLKVRNGMLPAIDNGIVVLQGYATPNPEEDQLPSGAVILNASDPAGLAAAMSETVGFLENNTPFGSGKVAEPREFMGEQVFDVDSLAQVIGPMVAVAQPNSGAYAIVGDKLILTAGEKGMIDHIIANLKKGTSSLEDHETLAESWKMWGNENLVEFGYSDLATRLKAAVYGSEEGIAVNAQVGEATEEEKKVAEAIKDMPSFEGFNYSITEKSYDTPEAWITRVYVAEKPGQ